MTSDQWGTDQDPLLQSMFNPLTPCSLGRALLALPLLTYGHRSCRSCQQPCSGLTAVCLCSC